MSNTIYIIITSILLLAGAASTLLLVFPSLAFMFLIAFGYALMTHFQSLSTFELGILAAIAIIAEVIDYIAGLWGAKIGGAKTKSLLFGMLGLIIGLVIYPPFGGIFGLFLGIVFGEIISYKEILKALKAGLAGVLGSLAGTVIKLLLALVFLILFLVFVI
ncbi:MAG: hypothetical protein HW405_136 [Candidatus Berkelbacteria bacterium]|nr:hypothetical protein [Candidatus Berkelbacteria bacterium]